MASAEITLTPDFDSDALAVLVRDEDGSARILLDGEAKELEDLVHTLSVKGAADEVCRTALTGNGRTRLVVFLGIGDGDADATAVRRAAGVLARVDAGAHGSFTLALPKSDPEVIEAAALGYCLGAYRIDKMTGRDRDEEADAQIDDVNEPKPASRLNLAVDFPAEESAEANLRASLKRATTIADAVAHVRDLVNLPPNRLGPADLAAEAERCAKARGNIDVRTWDADALREEGFGGLTAVGQGSSRGPRLVRLSYRPEGATKHVALVGKGITFDSGGLSIKPAASMTEMKTDMAGAATVLGVLEAIAALRAKVAVTGWMCLAENMPSGTATRPDDVIKMRNGLFVEVTNTDAEGRLVLADGMAAACEDDLPVDELIDIATLTGAQMVALGERTTGVMGNDDALTAKIAELARELDEPAWAMPIPEDARDVLSSDVADLVNAKVGHRYGGMLVAAAFLERFVGERDAKPVSWAHLDIAGPSFNRKGAYRFVPKGATGCMARTLIAHLEGIASLANEPEQQ